MQSITKNAYTESSETPSQLDELFEYTRSFRRYPKGFRALHLRFSVLDRLHKQPHHRRSIATAFNKLIGSKEGKLFWQNNFDLFFVCKNCSHTQLETVKLDALRAVEDSPILKELIEQSRDDELCDWYDLGIEYTAFYNLIEKLYRQSNLPDNTNEDETPSLQNLMANLDPENEVAVLAANKKDRMIEEPQPSVDYEEPKTDSSYGHFVSKNADPAMGPMQLDKLERNLQTMDMFALHSEQNICVIVEKQTPQVVFTKKYISLAEVNNSILPNYDISSDKWLFQRLTKTFDKKLMQALIDYDGFPEQVLSININVSTILTKEFDKFIAKQKTLSDHPLVLEITLFDIISDLNEYYKAYDKIHKLGCKICICKMDIQSLYILNRELMNVDFLKIKWNKVYKSSLSQSDKNRVINAITSQGKMRVVLSDCDTQDALDFGNSVGIVMFQGFEVDKLQGIKR